MLVFHGNHGRRAVRIQGRAYSCTRHNCLHSADLHYRRVKDETAHFMASQITHLPFRHVEIRPA